MTNARGTSKVRVRDAKGRTEDDARDYVAREAQRQAYGHIFSEAELEQFARGDISPSWELGNIRFIFVAELDGKIVGVADLTDLDDGWMLVEPMYVLPGQQRAGIGRMLWQRCVDAARSRKAPGLRVWVLKRNKIGNAFFTKMGCKPKSEGELVLGEHREEAIGYEFRLPSGTLRVEPIKKPEPRKV